MKLIKNILLAGAGLIIALPASSGINNTGKSFSDRPEFINSKFSKGGEIRLVVMTEYDDDTAPTFKILNEKFDEVASFSSPNMSPVTATKKIWRAQEGPMDIYVSGEGDNQITSPGAVPLEHFQDWAMGQGFTISTSINGEPAMLPDPNNRSWDYYYFDLFGTKYPQVYLVWRDGGIFEHRMEYSYNGWGSIGFSQEAEVETEERTPYPIDLRFKDALCVDSDDLLLTQNLFNDDDEYEFVVPIFSVENVSYTSELEKVEGQEIATTGFKVVSQSGKTVAEVQLPKSMRDIDDLYIYNMGSTNYLVVDYRVHEGSNYEYYYAVFEIDKVNASVAMVGAPQKVRVSPTAPVKGTDVQVSLGAPAENGSMVEVVSSTGRTVMRQRVAAGDTGTTINTASFERGVYVVLVNNGKTSREATKIVVR